MDETENAVNQRLKYYLKTNRISINYLSKILDVPQPTLHHQLNNGIISVDKLHAILMYFNDLSAEWLLRGVGSMIREDGKTIYQVNDGGDNLQGNVINKSDCTKFIDMLAEKDRQIAKLIDIIGEK